MGYYDDKDNDSQQYEDWRRAGEERGFFDRASDEVRSWFGDEEAEQRRRMDQHMGSARGERGYGRGREGMPAWQQRDYAGGSPRGSSIEERGRYESIPEGRGLGRNRGIGQRGLIGRDRGTEYGAYNRGSLGGWGGSDYDRQPLGRWEGQRPRFFGGQRDFESGMPYGSERSGMGYNNIGNRDYEDGRFGREARYNEMYGGMDEERSHRGRGPRNYRRSDERIADEINQFLTLHPELDASDIDVKVEEGIITLRGRVDSRHCKRLAEDIAEEVYGVREVHNELRVERMATGTLNPPAQDQTPGRPNLLSR